jgi:hypothetical protein
MKLFSVLIHILKNFTAFIFRVTSPSRTAFMFLEMLDPENEGAIIL